MKRRVYVNVDTLSYGSDNTKDTCSPTHTHTHPHTHTHTHILTHTHLFDDVDAAAVLLAQGDVGFLLVETDPEALQLLLDDLRVRVCMCLCVF
jgi:hypothetical protein